MSQKRLPDDGKGEDYSDDKRRRFSGFKHMVLEVMGKRYLQQWLEPVLEPVIRRVVKEEVELALRRHSSSMKLDCEKGMTPSESRSIYLQLQFLNNLSLPIFTGTKIEGEDFSKIRVALIDVFSGQTVNSGSEASAKVEIVVLEGDFDSDDGDNWTPEEFKKNIVRGRGGKKPLLTGDTVFILNEGVGFVGDISLTDNSSWTRSRKFRLGARVVENCDRRRIKEAKTQSFIVRDHRGELYKKHHPPSLCDEIWRLEKIAKDGVFHTRLNRENIKNVKDFLTALATEPTRLRNILGTGVSAKIWETMVDHARTCAVDKQINFYSALSSEQKTGVFFNTVGQVVGRLSDNQYVPADKLSESEKTDACNLVKIALKHQEEVLSFDDETFLSEGTVDLNSALFISKSPRMESSSSNKCLNSERNTEFPYSQQAIASPDMFSSMYSSGGVSGVNDYLSHATEHMGLTFSEDCSYLREFTNIPICDADAINAPFLEDLEDTCEFSLVSIDKAQRRWKKIFSVLQWFSIRRIVAKKRCHIEELPG